MNPPIFIFGVPRSGTTLLRTVLDSHPEIAAGPEAPWLAHQAPVNIRTMCEVLCDGQFSVCTDFGLSRAQVQRRIRELIDGLLGDFAHNHGKPRWAHKTPDDALCLDFFTQLFPEAKFIHLVRHPLDVAMSTTKIAPWRRGISQWGEQNLRLDHDYPVPNTLFNAVLRSRWWNHRIYQALHDRDYRQVSYESFVTQPQETFAELCHFLDIPFYGECLEYGKFAHSLPACEWGSTDVRQHGRVTAINVGRWQRELDQHQAEVLLSLAGRQPLVDGTANSCRLASVAEIESPRFKLFIQGINGLAEVFALRTHTNCSKIWEYPWLWFHGLADVGWEHSRVVDLGSGLSPMPWLFALLGAQVTLIERDAQWLPVWEQLRRRLNVVMDWQIVADEKLPLADRAIDVVTSFNASKHQLNQPKAVNEIVRILKPGGRLAMSFAIANPARDMELPTGPGQALQLTEFEEMIWRHPAFANPALPAWNLEDVPSVIQWHLQSGSHQRCGFGAALLRKSP